jgi:hypothetical protein
VSKDGEQKTANLVMFLLMRIYCDILSNIRVACTNLKNSNMENQRDVQKQNKITDKQL